ncbi:MAG: hypothetical protein UU22_C0030G0002 [Parcubacteria group bacterium GW2011_GWA2_40_8]|nr:MAG: hypothetical protein UT82_C0011G0011 [Parcubacteria group bacterium GW2011_GWB1_40_14]KKR78085.1 MAG: hypothetical protein UU22_C0030G0002 [Parcubacteria group bacterium GW2011_GWA2_40_8]
MSDAIYNIFNGQDPALFMGQIFSFIPVPEWLNGFISVYKIFAAIFSIAAFLAIVWVIIRLNRLIFSTYMQNITASFSAETLPADKISKQWAKIKYRIDRNTEAEWKLAVIEADKLVDDILKKMGYPGEDIAERLKTATPEQIQSLNLLREAHKLRDTVVHDPEFYASELEIKNAIDYYETFLREVQVID